MNTRHPRADDWRDADRALVIGMALIAGDLVGLWAAGIIGIIYFAFMAAIEIKNG